MDQNIHLLISPWWNLRFSLSFLLVVTLCVPFTLHTYSQDVKSILNPHTHTIPTGTTQFTQTTVMFVCCMCGLCLRIAFVDYICGLSWIVVSYMFKENTQRDQQKKTEWELAFLSRSIKQMNVLVYLREI